ncbi:MAG: T9SS type A sorting domain-containing protein, partial [Dehalococcoidia bacterium]
VTGASFCVAANNRPIYGMAWDDVCYAALGYANPMLWIHSQGGTPGLTMILFDPVACAYTADSCMGLQPGAIAGGMAFDADNYTPGVGKLLGFNQGTPDMMQAYEVCQTTGVSMSCTNLTPVFCQGKHVYFQVTTTNTTGAPITVTMTFTGYSGNGCVPGNEMVAIPSTKTIPVGVDTKNYFFKVPNAAGPGPYSAKISFTHAGTTYECCMNFTCVACNPWRVGDNTEWAWGEVDRPEIGLPTTTALAQNYPNPFNAETNIGYLLAEAGNVNLSVYDISGRLVETLLDGYQEAGEHIVTWNGSNVSSGVYFYKVTTSDYTATKMMNLLK